MENLPDSQPLTEEPPKPDPVPVATPTPLDLEALESMLAEAEQRGYDRARAEIATAEMNSPTVGEQPGAPVTEVAEEIFLSNIRPSVWD